MLFDDMNAYIYDVSLDLISRWDDVLEIWLTDMTDADSVVVANAARLPCRGSQS